MENEELYLSDALDSAILMHRDVHFGGKFSFMLEYYAKEGKGINQEFDIDRIIELEQIERDSGKNLAALLLTGSEAERVREAKESYENLRDTYEKDLKGPKLIADLILSEDVEADDEIKAIVKEGKIMVPALLDLIRSENYYDPLFPGYGYAPTLAAKALGQIGDKKAIVALFEMIGEGDLLNEEWILDALKAIGEPAKEFLLHVLHAKPITYDNERAAVALLHFDQDPKIALVCFDLLKSIDVKKDKLLATHLILGCEGLCDKKDREAFIEFSKKELPKDLLNDMKMVMKEWKN